MSTRRSGRATKAVKYTSASEGSDFEDKPQQQSNTNKRGKAAYKKSGAAKKSTKRAAAEPEAAPEGEDEAPPKPKRQKKDPETAAAEAHEKAAAKQAKADKAAHKKAWETWLKEHDAGGELLEEEPGKQESITQTDALKKYGLKKEELGSLLHFEKKNPLYGGVMKLFLEENVRELGFRKVGMLEGVEGGDEEVVKRGEEIWTEEHKDDPEPKSVEEKPEKPAKKEDSKPSKTEKAQKKENPAKTKTPKQEWTEYITSHAISSPDRLTEKPAEPINQTLSKERYDLKPQDLTTLPYFGQENVLYKNTIKYYDESEVRTLAYRKTAVLAGVEESDDVVLLEKGKVLFEGENDDEEDEGEEGGE